jgi:hypothetical protein
VDAAIVIALIALAGSLLTTVATVFGTPHLQARREATVVLETYRGPLLEAAYELQSRLYNTLSADKRFADAYLADNSRGKQEAARLTTAYVFAQYFGWREIIRRRIQYLRFRRNSDTQKTSELLVEIEEAFLTDKHGEQLMVWRLEQRGIGERMVVDSDERLRCVGYSEFVDERMFEDHLLEEIVRDFERLDDGGRARLRELQHLLVRLVRKLDPNKIRYPQELGRV